MGVTRLQNIFSFRSLLDNPYPSHPSFDQMFRQELREEMDIVNATLQTGKAWATATYQLNYSTNQDTYEINVSDWGKVLYVVKETDNQYTPYVAVPFDDVNNTEYGSVWNDNSAFQIDQTPERMSFYREGVLNAQYKVRIQPQPQASATYQITYLPGYIGVDDPLESSIQMPEHAELVRLRAATALLPYAKWHEDEDKNSNKRKELATSYLYQLERKEDNFRRYIRSIAIPRHVEIEDFIYG